MADYISREAAIAYIREQSEELQKAFEELGGESGIYADAYNDLAEDFHRIPAADVEPVRRGRWKIRRKSDWPEWTIRIVCSSCGLITGQKSKYCPNCGSKMQGAENE